MGKYKVIIASSAGFCKGVKRAIKITEEILKKAKNQRVFSLGEVVHNKIVNQSLKNKGLIITEDEKEIKSGDILIIRAHGMPEPEILKLKERNIKIIDATCPYVLKIKRIAEKMEKEGYDIYIYGDKTHPEIRTITGNLKKYVILESIDAREIKKGGKAVLLSQTTQNYENFKKVIELMFDKFYELRIFNTICDATVERQESAYNLAKKVDLMIVIGSKNSANTRRLFEICKKENPDTLWIETVKDLARIPENITTIGITAGASTPDYIITEVYRYLTSL